METDSQGREDLESHQRSALDGRRGEKESETGLFLAALSVSARARAGQGCKCQLIFPPFSEQRRREHMEGR